MNLYEGRIGDWTPEDKNTYGMGLSQGRTASLGHPDVTEFSFLNKFPECTYRFLDWNSGVDSSTLKQVQSLCPPEVLVDILDAAPDAFFTAVTPPFDRQESFLSVFRVLSVEFSEQVQVG